MKRQWKIVTGIIIVSLVGLILWPYRTVDILKAYPDHQQVEEAESKGRELLAAMESAYGGRDKWLAYETAYFIQYANWYERLRMSGWDTLPQLFSLNTVLGSNDCDMELLGGARKGSKYRIESGIFSLADTTIKMDPNEANHFTQKMIYKNYWFQFPFRIGEAEIIKYWGEMELDGVNYKLLYATWSSLKANKNYDQFMMFINPQTHLIEHLHFTVRERFRSMQLTARFTDFRLVDESIKLPYSQYVRLGPPMESGLGMHENHYEFIRFGESEE